MLKRRSLKSEIKRSIHCSFPSGSELMKPFVLVSFIFLSFFLQFSDSFNCSTIEGSRLTTLCYDAVDYEFYLPDGISQTYLNEQVMTFLGSSEISLLPTECQSSLKLLACSQTYLKCDPSGNTNIYSDVGLTVPLPFQRPCASVCEKISDACMGILPFLGISLNCTAKYDYSNGQIPFQPYQYDQNNDPSVCNMLNVSLSIASTAEPYVGGSQGVCFGIVQETFVPSASLISSSFAPFQSPYLVQTLIEQELKQHLDLLPPWISSSCHLALKKYFCGSAFLRPQLIRFQDIIDDNYFLGSVLQGSLSSSNYYQVRNFSFSLPSYPSQDICLEYESTCAEFIAISGLSSLVPNCSSVSSASGTSVHSFPTTNQSVASLTLMGYPISFSTSPNKMASSQDAIYSTRCPSGYVVPDEPDDPLIDWIPGTGCAVACRIPMYTIHEWDTIFYLIRVIGLISLPLILILWMRFIFFENLSSMYLTIYFITASLVPTIYYAIMISHNFRESDYCRNNAVGLTNEEGINFCTAEAVIFSYFALMASISWCITALDLLQVIVFSSNTRSTRRFWIRTVIILGFPFISCLYLCLSGLIGYGGFIPWCYVSKKSTHNEDLYSFYIPMIVATVIGTISMIIVLTTFFVTRRKVQQVVPEAQNSVAFNWKVFYTPISNVLLYLIVWIAMVVHRCFFYFNYTRYANAFTDWTMCVFTYYDGVTDSSWEIPCGKAAHTRADFFFVAFVYSVLAGQSIFFFIVFGRKINVIGFLKFTWRILMMDEAATVVVKNFVSSRQLNNQRLNNNRSDGPENVAAPEVELAVNVKPRANVYMLSAVKETFNEVTSTDG